MAHTQGWGGNEGAIESAMQSAHTAVLCSLALAWLGLPSGGAAAERPKPRAVEWGRSVVGPDGVTAAEEVRLSPDLGPRLLRLAESESLRVADWPVAAGVRQDVTLTRHDVYALGAVVYRADGDALTPLPRSPLAFFWGTASDGSGARVLAVVDPVRGAVTGSAHSTHGTSELRAAAGGRHLVAAADAFLAGEDVDWRCSGDEESGLPEIAAPAADTNTPGGPLHMATIAVDTDNELLALKFSDNTTAASNYIASLFASMNVIYERDLGVRMLQGTTILRVSTTPDPYTQAGSGASSAQLTELKNYWSSTCGAPCTSVQRATVALLSGKSGSPNSASGIAFVNVLCSANSGYSFSQVFRSNYLAGDTMLVGHELGHNFGSRHTHCTPPSPFIDNCYNGEGASPSCFSGSEVCPASQTYHGVTFKGSLMSYCHMLSGCSSSPVFHPRTVNEVLTSILQSKVGVCLFAAFGVTSVEPNSGSTAGGLRVTVRGSDFRSGASVSFGGASGTGVTVVDSNTLTVTTPPHAAGIVDVVVTNPGPVSATLAGGFFFMAPPSPTKLYTVTPCRAVDTRSANPPALAAGGTRAFTLAGVAAGACNIPGNAVAVAVNITVDRSSQPGHLVLFPANGLMPSSSHINFKAGVTRANNAVLLLATDGSGRIKVFNGSAAAADCILDVTGYFR